MPTAYSYLRFSSKKQEQGDSLKRQKNERDIWLTQNPEYKLAPESFNLEDLAVSAFKTKKNKNRTYENPLDALLSGSNLDPKTGKLGVFIALVESKESPIQDGDILILETLDRFSRLPAAYQMSAFTRILAAGVNILLLTPTPSLVTLDTIKETGEIIMLIVKMQAAYEYSLQIQRRVAAAWNRKREKAQNGEVITKQLPAWIAYDKKTQKLTIKKEAAPAIKYLFNRTIDGTGQNVIVREMNEKFPAFTARKGNENPTWNTSYISKILSDKSTYGVFQPYRFDEERVRKPDGPPIKDYFPAVITEDIFNAAQASTATRKRTKLTKASFVNLLEGLVTNLEDGSICHVQTLRQKRTDGSLYIQRRLQSYKKRNGVKGSSSKTIDYFPLQRLVGRALTCIDQFGLSQPEEGLSQDKEMIERAIAGLLMQIKETEEELKISRLPKQISRLSSLLEEQEQKLRTYQERHKLVSRSSHHSPSDEWLKRYQKEWHFESCLDLLGETNDDALFDSLRQTKSEFQAVIREILCLPLKKKNRTVAGMHLLVLSTGETRIIIQNKIKICKEDPEPDALPVWHKQIQIHNANKDHLLIISEDGLVIFQGDGRWGVEGTGRKINGGFDMDGMHWDDDACDLPQIEAKRTISSVLEKLGCGFDVFAEAVSRFLQKPFDLEEGLMA